MPKNQWSEALASAPSDEQDKVMSLAGYHKVNTKEPATEQERDIGEVRERPWPPPMKEEAYYGLTGEVVRAIEPYSEADPAALLITWLVMVGNLLHRSATFPVGADDHHCNLFAAIVGPSGKGRKGMSANFIKKILENVDALWVKTKITSGMNSGEGVIYAVRNATIEKQAIKDPKTKEIIDYQQIVTDHGVLDKRLMIVEGEFAQALKVMARQGNILSPVVRQAWDSGNINSLVKNFKNQATDAHISIIGHITIYELQDLLKEVEMVNGFGNRFLWALARRSKYLPHGATLPLEEINALAYKLNKVIQFARLHTILEDIETREPGGFINLEPLNMIRDTETAEYWESMYPVLSQEEPGLCGAMINRAEAQVLRISMIYALLDCSTVINITHLNAALAVWKYCESSARYLFGGKSGNPTAEEILIALEVKGEMTQTDVVNLFDRLKPAAAIKKALEELLEMGLVEQYKSSGKPGRPVTMWKLVKNS